LCSSSRSVRFSPSWCRSSIRGLYLRVHPVDVWGGLGVAPRVEDGFGESTELGSQISGHGVDGELEAVAVGIEEVDGLADLVIGGSDDVDAVGFEPGFLLEEGVHVVDCESEVLHPVGCAGVELHIGRLG
jgi:hypothetical protein